MRFRAKQQCDQQPSHAAIAVRRDEWFKLTCARSRFDEQWRLYGIVVQNFRGTRHSINARWRCTTLRFRAACPRPNSGTSGIRPASCLLPRPCNKTPCILISRKGIGSSSIELFDIHCGDNGTLSTSFSGTLAAPSIFK